MGYYTILIAAIGEDPSGLPFPVQVIRPAGEREAAEQQANPGMDASTLVGAFPADAARDGAVSPAQHRPLVLE